MPYTVIDFRDTPNPNALKCVLDRSPGAKPRSYRSAPEASGDALGAAVMAIPGVTGVLIHDGWLTVSKDAGTGWGAIKPALKAALAAAE